jgi:murein DD-endopeptidase MepM/ murein hydrolase activator NlpD
MFRRSLILLLLLCFLFPWQVALAQDDPPTGPVYIVESGDTFTSIAIKFGVTVDDLIRANPQLDPNLLSIGAEVVIPGLEGIQGKLVTVNIPLGESLRTISIRNNIPTGQVAELNRLTSPAEVFAGANLIIPQDENLPMVESRYLLGENQTLLQVALEHNTNPWLLAETNQITGTWELLPGEAIFGRPGESGEGISLIAPMVKELVVNPLPIEQGETALVQVTTNQPVELSGSLAGYPLSFFPNGENVYVALQGVYVMADPGIYPFVLSGRRSDGAQFSFEQMVILEPLGYIQEKIDGVDATTMDPAVTKPEDEQVRAVITKPSPNRYWDGLFAVPGYDPTWITSTFGNRRSYNGGPYIYFHTGVDYGGGTGLEIKSPAPGVVVFAAPLTVRGNATIIDHGWGVFSGFWHQSEFRVQTGQRVETGQVIGLVGGTGRITGPHLHWEVWVNGVQVNPLTWLEQPFP